MADSRSRGGQARERERGRNGERPAYGRRGRDLDRGRRRDSARARSHDDEEGPEGGERASGLPGSSFPKHRH